MPKVTISAEGCKGCGLCISVCPQNVLAFERERLNLKGYYPVAPARPEHCTGCALCALMCPDCVIVVEK